MEAETTIARMTRLQQAAETLVMHSPQDSFPQLIARNQPLFHGFRVIYSTNNFDSALSYLSLKDIETECPSAKRFFFGDGLVFYTDEIYRRARDQKQIKIPIDYSFTLDSNIAEQFRVWENGGSLDALEKRFENLVRFIKKRRIDEQGEQHSINFDCSYFIIENFKDAMDPGNTRVFNTVRAIKRFDFLEYIETTFDVKHPVFTEDQSSSGRRAIEAIHGICSSSEVSDLLQRRKRVYAVLLKAVLLKARKKLSLNESLRAIIDFSLENLGAYSKKEIYFAWKYFKKGTELDFFNPVSQLNDPRKLDAIKSMSGDLYLLRYLESLMTAPMKAEFYVPLLISFDKRFVDLIKACPIRAVIFDDREQRCHTIFVDEREAFEDIFNALPASTLASLRDPKKKIQRMAREVSAAALDQTITRLEQELFP